MFSINSVHIVVWKNFIFWNDFFKNKFIQTFGQDSQIQEVFFNLVLNNSWIDNHKIRNQSHIPPPLERFCSSRRIVSWGLFQRTGVWTIFSVTSSNVHCTPSSVFAEASMNSVRCRFANFRPSSRVTTRLGWKSEVFWVKLVKNWSKTAFFVLKMRI